MAAAQGISLYLHPPPAFPPAPQHKAGKLFEPVALPDGGGIGCLQERAFGGEDLDGTNCKVLADGLRGKPAAVSTTTRFCYQPHTPRFSYRIAARACLQTTSLFRTAAIRGWEAIAGRWLSRVHRPRQRARDARSVRKDTLLANFPEAAPLIPSRVRDQSPQRTPPA